MLASIASRMDPTALNPGGPDPSGAFSGFFAIFIVIFVLGIGLSVFKFLKTREMAMRKGASESEATAVALSGDVATAAAFLKRDGAKPAEQRIREVRSLQQQGLISAEQAEQRVAEILRNI